MMRVLRRKLTGSSTLCGRAAIAAGLGCLWLTSNAQAPARGSDIFDSACAHCHGENGQGGPLAPSILQRVGEADDAELAAFLRVGAPDRGMPPAPVTGEQMEALVDYLRFLGSAASTGQGRDADASRGAAPSIESFRAVTEAVLQSPDDADWLPSARTRDGRAFSPLDDVNAANVQRLALAWARGLPPGPIGTAPIVYAGVMFIAMRDGSIAALDAATGDAFWQHPGDGSAEAGARGDVTLSLFGDRLYVTRQGAAPFALDVQSGARVSEGSSPPAELTRSGERAESAGGSVLATAGGLIFRGDGRRYQARAEPGDVLWETILGGAVAMGGISYAVDGRQYIAVIAGGTPSSSASGASAAGSGGGDSGGAPGALYVFALPETEDRDQP